MSTHLQWSVNPLTNGGGSGGIMGVWEFTIAASYQPKASQWGVCNSEVEESPQEIKVGNGGNNLFGKIFPTIFSVKQSQCNAVKWFHILIPTFHWTVVLRSNMYLQSDRSKPEVKKTFWTFNDTPERKISMYVRSYVRKVFFSSLKILLLVINIFPLHYVAIHTIRAFKNL